MAAEQQKVAETRPMGLQLSLKLKLTLLITTLLVLTVLGDRVDRGAWLERALATVCAVAAAVLVGQEGLANTQALGLALIWLGLAATVGWPQGLTSASGSDSSGR